MAASEWLLVAENGIAPTALIAGGGWAAWKWRFSESLRKLRDVPSPDGTLAATSILLPDGKACVSLQALWRNRGDMLIELCAEHSFIDYCELKGDIPLGSLKWGVDGPLATSIRLEAPWLQFVMEPRTETLLTEHFVVETGSIYVFRWQICVRQAPLKADGHGRCVRELIWRVPHE